MSGVRFDEEALLPRRRPYDRRTRTWSLNSLDPNEDPVAGLERVASNTNLEHLARRRRREAEEQRSALISRRTQSVDAASDSALSARFESLNYEVFENKLYRDAEKSSTHQAALWQQSRNRWIACFFIGVFTALVAAFVDMMVHYSKEFKFNGILKYLLSKCNASQRGTTSGCMWEVMASWITYNCVLVSIAASLVIYVSPIAGGSGIPQIKCYLNGIAVPEVVRLKTLIAKAIGVSCAVGGGLAAGKEGPMIHSGAVVGAGISQGRSQSLNVDFGFFKAFRNDRDRRDFVSAGAAAGVAAAFGAPIGGVLFSLEEGASFWNQNLTWRMFFSAMISSFTVSWILSWFNGRSGWLSWTGLANFGVFENNNYNIWEIPFFLMIGIIGGVLGALFNYMNSKLTEFRKKYVNSRFARLFECLLVAAVSAFLGFVTIFLVDDCQPVGINPNTTEINQMWCKKGEYSAVASLFFQNPEESVKSLFHSPMNSYRVNTLVIFAIEYYLLTLWTFGISVPSGVFIPALLTGAAWGRVFGIYVERLFPSVTGIDPGKYALAGAAAQLGGIVRMTISLTAIIMEATKNITFGLPIMVVLMITKWVGDMFNEGLYDTHIDLAEVPVLGWNPPHMSRNILAGKVMRADVVALEPRERVSRLLEILRATAHHGFPIVDRIEESTSQHQNLPDYGRLKGYILRNQLVKLLQLRAFEADESSSSSLRDKIEWADFQDVEDKNTSLADLRLRHQDESRWVNFEPYMHPHPHRVPLNASLPFIFRLFRGLGLRYLFVVNDDNKLRGVITRKDVARFRGRRHNQQYRVDELYIAEDIHRN